MRFTALLVPAVTNATNATNTGTGSGISTHLKNGRVMALASGRFGAMGHTSRYIPSATPNVICPMSLYLATRPRGLPWMILR